MDLLGIHVMWRSALIIFLLPLVSGCFEAQRANYLVEFVIIESDSCPFKGLGESLVKPPVVENMSASFGPRYLLDSGQIAGLTNREDVAVIRLEPLNVLSKKPISLKQCVIPTGFYPKPPKYGASASLEKAREVPVEIRAKVMPMVAHETVQLRYIIVYTYNFTYTLDNEVIVPLGKWTLLSSVGNEGNWGVDLVSVAIRISNESGSQAAMTESGSDER